MCKQALLKLTEAGLKLGLNWQKEFTELISDIAARDNMNPIDVVDAPEIEKVLSDKKLNAPQKRVKVKKELQRKRYPLYFLAKEEFDRRLKNLKLSPKIKVKPAPFFENEQLNIEYEYDDQAELKKIQADIKRLKKAYLVKNTIDYVENKVHV